MTSLVEESNVKKPESSAMEEKEVEIEETSQDLSEDPSEKETDLEKVKADFEETEVKDSTDSEVKSQTDKKENTSGGRVIVITSGKGGVGKTTTNANIGTALARAGKKVVMIDTDLGLRNLDLLLGLENRIVYTIVDVVEERCKLRQALVKDKKNPNLCLLAAAQTRDKSAVTEDQLREICEELKQTFDFILVDCPAGIEQGFQNAVAGASEAIVVTTPEMSAVRDADRIIGLLEAREEIKTYKVLVNRVRPNLIKEKNMMSVEDVLELLSANLIGVIPEDTGIITSTNKGEPIVNDEKSLAGQAYRNVAKRIIGEDVPFLNLEEDTGFGAKVKKFFNKLMGKENN